MTDIKSEQLKIKMRNLENGRGEANKLDHLDFKRETINKMLSYKEVEISKPYLPNFYHKLERLLITILKEYVKRLGMR